MKFAVLKPEVKNKKVVLNVIKIEEKNLSEIDNIKGKLADLNLQRFIITKGKEKSPSLSKSYK
jgi:hypothetical protein